MREISALQELVAALSNLEALERFSCDASTCTGMNLTWSTGSATPGYKELQRAMSECVRGPMWREIYRMAMDEARARIEVARRHLHEAQSSTTSAEGAKGEQQ